MKKSINMNLSGQIFHIDEDAYGLLENYLDNLKYHFKRTGDDPEIVQEFESRIAEHLLAQTNTQSRVVNIELISRVIGLMGQPEEIFDTSSTSSQGTNIHTPPEAQGITPNASMPHASTTTQGTTSRRLYRDIDNA